MKKTINAIITCALASTLSVTAFGGAGSGWGYEGDHGPDHWGDLDPSYAMCSVGTQQSPIDISSTTPSESLSPLKLKYKKSELHIVNNGHTIKVSYAPGSYLKLAKKNKYQLLQFHFHAASENTVDGVQYPLEVHFVHANDEGQLAVVGVLFEAGEHNKALAPIFDNMPTHGGDETTVVGEFINAKKLLPENREYVHFAGSLTTPPCSEGVKWFVMKERVEVSAEQLAQFTTLYHNNYRPVQNLNGRVILEPED